MTNVADADPALNHVCTLLKLIEQIRQVIAQSQGCVFHDGMHSPLSEEIHCLIPSYGLAAVHALKEALKNCRGSEISAVEEILRQIGLVEDEATHQSRLELLVEMLKSSEGGVRDAALLGLSFLDDPKALSHLIQARSHETESWLIENLSQVIEQLEQPRSGI